MDRFVVRVSKNPGAVEDESKPTRSNGFAKPRPSSWGSRGGYLASRAAKQRAQAPKARSMIFKGVNAYFTGVFTHSQFKLTRLIYENGGTVAPMWSRRSVTHVVCDQLATSKVNKELSLDSVGRAKSVRSWIVKPQWVVDCVEGGRRLPEADYSVIRDRQMADMRTLLKNTGKTRSAKNRSPQLPSGKEGNDAARQGEDSQRPSLC